MPTDRLPQRIETPRLVVRVATPSDAPVFNTAVIESREELAPWLSWVTPPPTAEKADLDCRRAYARFLLNEDLMALIFLKEGGTLVGGSGLHGANWTTRTFEIGYWCRTGYGGKGFITEAVRALSDYALIQLEANRVFLTCDDRNIRSWKLAERAGFTLEGVLVNERFDPQGRLRNTRVYARTDV